MRILINCSNLHGGGSAAVAASFLYQVAQETPKDIEISLLLSSYVAGDLNALGANLENFKEVKILDYFGIEALWRGLSAHMKGYDGVFTVFGPAYILGARSYTHIVGFAQPSIIYPDRISLFERSLLRRVALRVKYFLQEIFFSASDVIVVELEHVKKALLAKNKFSRKDLFVVRSTVDNIYLEPERWKEAPQLVGGRVKLGLVSRNYPHKNIKILSEVKEVLYEKYGMDVDFYVTFSSEEWDSCSEGFKSNIKNVGRLELAQCPSFYSQLDGVVFPSLLECFSAVPLEAMILRKPLFASDLGFIKDCCDDFALYFDPMSAGSIADAIYKGLSEGVGDLELARTHAIKFGGASRRAKEYMSLIRDKIESRNV